MSTLDQHALREACYGLARTVMQRRQLVDVTAVDALADKLTEIASEHAEFVTGQDRDPNLIVRAVRYIDHTHAMPGPDQTRWFGDVLQVLIELACPNAGQSKESAAFLDDVQEGIEVSRLDFDGSEDKR